MRFLKTSVFIFFALFSLTVFAQKGNTDYQYALIEAVKQKNLGNLPGAIELYKMVLEEKETVAVAHYELGTLYAVSGNTENAVDHLKRANEITPGNKWYFESYIDVLLMQEEYNTAKKLLKRRIREKPENVDHLFKLANVHFLAGKTGRAIRTLERIEDEYGISDKIIMLKANIFEADKDYNKARKEVEKLIRVFPESVEFHVVAAELAQKNNNSDLAAEHYQEVVELDSMNIYALTNLTDYYREKEDFGKSLYFLEKSFRNRQIPYERKMAILSFYLSDEYFFKNYKEELSGLINRMMEMYPEKKEIHLFGTDFYIQHNQYDKALDALMPILQKDERKYEIWRQGILLANSTGRDEEMLQISRKAYKLFPDSAEIIYYKGIAEYEKALFGELIQTFNKQNLAKLENPSVRSQATIIKAEAYYRVNNFDASDSLFRSILEVEQNNFMVMNNFSYYLSERGHNLEEAEKYSRKTINHDPDNSTYLDTYAWILFKMEEYEDAEDFILRALRNGGKNDADINEHAGDIYMKLGNYRVAEEFYREALIMGGEKEVLNKKLRDINEKKQGN